MRLIDADALKKAFEDTVCIEPMPYAFVKQIIDNAPTVAKDYDTGYQDGLEDGLNDIRPQGEWKTVPEYNFNDKCSVCGELNCWKRTNFCPHCGAEMKHQEVQE